MPSTSNAGLSSSAQDHRGRRPCQGFGPGPRLEARIALVQCPSHPHTDSSPASWPGLRLSPDGSPKTEDPTALTSVPHSPPAPLAGKEILEWVVKNYWNRWKRISGISGKELLEYSNVAPTTRVIC